MNTNTTTEREIKMRKIEIGSKVQIGEEIWVVCEIDETEIRLGLNGQIKVFKR